MTKKMLGFPLACLALAGAVQAQSGVTLSGAVDLSLQRTSSSGKGSVWQVNNSGLATSRLVFSGNEDLGGGLRAGFWLESGLNPDTGGGRANNTNNQPSGALAAGGLTFDRMAYVRLSAGWGEMRLGRDFTPTQYTNIYYDAFNTLGVGRIGNLTYPASGAGPLPTTITTANSISYWTPGSLGGFYGMAMLAFGENASGAPTSDDGRMHSLRAGYANKSLDVSGAYSVTRYAATPTLGEYRHANLGATWDAGFVKVYGLYSNARVGLSTGAVRKDVWSVGARFNVQPTGVLRVSYAQLGDRSAAALRNANASARSDNDARQFAIGYIYHLSKRTALYGSYARIDNRGQAVYAVFGGQAPVPGGSSSGFEAGVRHIF